MHEKKGFTKRAEEFLNGKGFYIVLFVCVAVIGVSAWLLLFSEFSPLNLGDDEGDYLDVMADTGDTDDVSAPIDLRDDEELESGDDDTQPQSQVNPGSDAETPQSGGVTGNDPEGQAQTGSGSQDEPVQDGAGEQEQEDQPTVDDLEFLWPLVGEVVTVHSPDTLIYDTTMGDWRTHDGVDIAASQGTKVTAIADGTVTDISEDDMLGTTVTIDHGAGVVSVYANMAGVPTVEVGDSVTMGSVIGSVGDTALAESGQVAHLHLAMTVDGQSTDPTQYLP